MPSNVEAIFVPIKPDLNPRRDPNTNIGYLGKRPNNLTPIQGGQRVSGQPFTQIVGKEGSKFPGDAYVGCMKGGRMKGRIHSMLSSSIVDCVIGGARSRHIISAIRGILGKGRTRMMEEVDAGQSERRVAVCVTLFGSPDRRWSNASFHTLTSFNFKII
ncbi:hypothetical protein ARMGADRAFT_1035080 [Armillaria gallica]|uniref:Uncharacterized protein n=1 Tax=Armillaria gallica TaxID=47427 RepID=A0A2H3DDM0_ARMGA|nr:hypothetical protein ARMGADRAFT_1035080 [Armillaria gallica]